MQGLHDEGWGLQNAIISAEVKVATNGGTAVPEPSTMLLLGSGLIGIIGLRRRLKA